MGAVWENVEMPKLTQVLALITLAGVASGCNAPSDSAVDRQTTAVVGKLEPTANKDSVESFPAEGEVPAVHPLKKVVTIVEADVERVWYEYDEELGPRTYVALTNMSVHAGRGVKKVFSQLGGPLPD